MRAGSIRGADRVRGEIPRWRELGENRTIVRNIFAIEKCKEAGITRKERESDKQGTGSETFPSPPPHSPHFLPDERNLLVHCRSHTYKTKENCSYNSTQRFQLILPGYAISSRGVACLPVDLKAKVNCIRETRREHLKFNLRGIWECYSQNQPVLRATGFHGYQFLSTQEILACKLTMNQCLHHSCGT